MDMTCLGAGTVAGEGSTSRGGGTGAEDLTEVGCFAEVDGGGCLQEIESGGVCGEDVETFTEDPFEFWKSRIVGGDKGAEVVVMGGLRAPSSHQVPSINSGDT